MNSTNHDGNPKWRAASIADLEIIDRIGNEIHVDLPERPEVFADKFSLFPEGCFVLVQNQEVVGYVKAQGDVAPQSRVGEQGARCAGGSSIQRESIGLAIPLARRAVICGRSQDRIAPALRRLQERRTFNRLFDAYPRTVTRLDLRCTGSVAGILI